MNLTETVSFGGIEVAFNGDVLRPRQWTIIQSEWASELSEGLPPGPILELCAGVGHIGLVAAQRTGRALVQVEVSEVAASLARDNAHRAGIMAEVRNGDVADALSLEERFPLVIADPPYLPTDEVEQYADDPAMAVDGGDDGMTMLRRCADVAARHLVIGGALLMQLRGTDQASALTRATPALRLVQIRSVDAERAVALFMSAE